MPSIVKDFLDTTSKSHNSVAIQTTLYNLIAALDDEVGPDEEAVLTATVAHLLNTHRVTCTGSMKGYRLVCSRVEPVARSGPRAPVDTRPVGR
jgi:hypothetical protein